MAFTFNDVPAIKYNRSRFDLSHSVKTSGNVGTLYPFEVQEVYPGDTFKVKTSIVSRLTSQFLRPVMDNLFLDVYYFYVPSRLLYDKFVNVMGENTSSAWANTVDYDVPTFNGSVGSGTIGDFLGLPVGMSLNGVSVLPFRAFAKIYDEWFRDQNNVSPMLIQTGELASSEIPNSNSWGPGNYFGLPPKVAKLHDYFTSALPAPQKGSAVDISTSVLPATKAPVKVGESISDYSDIEVPNDQRHLIMLNSAILSPGNDFPLYMKRADGAMIQGGSVGDFNLGLTNSTPTSNITYTSPANLWAYIPEQAVGAVNVNDLRFAFQYQKMLERDARGGTRFVEYLQSHFGVRAGDYRLQRSEFLGGKRTPISIHQVTQTTGSGSSSSPLGEVGAYSLSNSKNRFTKGFVEHGFVVGVYCIRQFHSYQQGVEKFWKRSKRTDFYDPVFASIGEQPIMATELYGSAEPDRVFGYNEAWADLRYRPNHVSGHMRSGVSDSLDFWHFGDYYNNVPTLSQGFIEETPDYVNRAITVDSSSQPQFILDFYIQNVAYRVLPTYSVPGLIDHH